MTVENLGFEEAALFYQINDILCDIAREDDLASCHARFRRSNPAPCREPRTILDGVESRGISLEPA